MNFCCRGRGPRAFSGDELSRSFLLLGLGRSAGSSAAGSLVGVTSTMAPGTSHQGAAGATTSSLISFLGLRDLLLGPGCRWMIACCSMSTLVANVFLQTSQVWVAQPWRFL